MGRIVSIFLMKNIPYVYIVINNDFTEQKDW